MWLQFIEKSHQSRSDIQVSWLAPVCVKGEVSNQVEWIDPVCVTVPMTFEAEEGSPQCVVDKIEVNAVWSEYVCVQTTEAPDPNRFPYKIPLPLS
jgi:hypothetical protein